MREEIAIYIGYEKSCADEIIKQIALGIEEEGVPYVMVPCDEQSAEAIGRSMSMLSKLDVGIGVDQLGNLCIHHKKFPDGFYLFPVNRKECSVLLRCFGANGARLSKGVPFKKITE